MKKPLIFSGSSHQQFAIELSKHLDVSLGKIAIETFPDQEIGIQILDSIINQDVFLIQTIAKRPNHYLMELLLMIDACKRGGANRIFIVIPYFGYARQDRISKEGEPITAKLIANLLEKAGAFQIITMDVHSCQLQGFFDIPFSHLQAKAALVTAINNFSMKSPIVVSPDIGSNQLARRFSEELKLDLAFVDKKRLSKEEVSVQALIGDVKGKEVILVDDICSTGNTLISAAKICKERGAKKVYAVFTHGLMSKKFFNFDQIDHIFMTNTVPFEEENKKLDIISVASIFADSIKKIVAS